MIAYLKGKLAEKNLTDAVIDVHGIGYFVNIPMSTYDLLPRLNEEVILKTHMIVKEDDMQLYGFVTEDERILFRLLINISGVGAKTANVILSSFPVPNFCQAVMALDVKLIAKIKGLGKKTAERLVIELKDKVEALAYSRPSKNATSQNKESDLNPGTVVVISDAVLALDTLGFRSDKTRKILNEIVHELSSEDLTSEKLIKEALNRMNK